MENLRWRQAHSSHGLTWITTTQILEEIFDDTVEPRLSGLFDYPDLFSVPVFFMYINKL